jgi:hypothetical protein
MKPDYSNGKIYKIVSFQTDKVYVGSTTSRLSKRLSEHISAYKYYEKYKKGRVITSFEIVQYDDCDIVLLENFSCDSKEELHGRERHFIERMDCVNKCIPTRTIKEYKEDHKDRLKKQNKLYKEANKETIKQNGKIYRENNKDIIREKKKQYREANKDRLRAHKSKQCICPCGSTYTYCHQKRHFRTAKHQQFQNVLDHFKNDNEFMKAFENHQNHKKNYVFKPIPNLPI